MKLQFGISSILLATAFVALWLGSNIVAWRVNQAGDPAWMIAAFVADSPFLIPFVFVAYAFGRRKITVGLLVVFAVAQALSIYFGPSLGVQIAP